MGCFFVIEFNTKINEHKLRPLSTVNFFYLNIITAQLQSLTSITSFNTHWEKIKYKEAW